MILQAAQLLRAPTIATVEFARQGVIKEFQSGGHDLHLQSARNRYEQELGRRGHNDDPATSAAMRGDRGKCGRTEATQQIAPGEFFRPSGQFRPRGPCKSRAQQCFLGSAAIAERQRAENARRASQKGPEEPIGPETMTQKRQQRIAAGHRAVKVERGDFNFAFQRSVR